MAADVSRNASNLARCGSPGRAARSIARMLELASDAYLGALAGDVCSNLARIRFIAAQAPLRFVGKRVVEALERQADGEQRIMHRPFAGDAHAFLMAVYKNPKLDLHTRIDAAKAAIGYEKPRLASIAMPRRSLDEMSDEELLEFWDTVRALQRQQGKSGQAH
jgi:hypothetical protein